MRDQTRSHARDIVDTPVARAVVLLAAEVVEQDLEGRAVVAAPEVLPGVIDEERGARREARARDGDVLETLGEALERVLEDGEQQLVLAAEVMLHGAPGHAGALRDLLRGQALEAVARR